jgi:hypothetical protein
MASVYPPTFTLGSIINEGLEFAAMALENGNVYASDAECLPSGCISLGLNIPIATVEPSIAKCRTPGKAQPGLDPTLRQRGRVEGMHPPFLLMAAARYGRSRCFDWLGALVEGEKGVNPPSVSSSRTIPG